MIALTAQRCGVSAEHYVRTRTWAQFALDVRAWVHSWARPLELVLGDKKKDGKKKGSGARPDLPTASDDGVPPWYRRKKGTKYTVFDLGPTTKQQGGIAEDDDPADWNYSRAMLVRQFSVRGGVGRSPLRAKPVSQRVNMTRAKAQAGSGA